MNEDNGNAKVKIDHGVPIPNIRKNWGWQTDIIKQMAIGDSIVVPRKYVNSIRATSFHQGLRFIARAINEQESRMWRVK